MNKCMVVNIRKENTFAILQLENIYGKFIYIGRPSIYGNPFKIGKDGTREEVIEKFKFYFNARINTDSEFEKKVLELKGKILGCYCKPLACHGDVIAEYVNGIGR